MSADRPRRPDAPPSAARDRADRSVRAGQAPSEGKLARTGKVSGSVRDFLNQADQTPAVAPAGAAGRLGVIIDATMSREATWDMAMSIQGEMFAAAAEHGGVLVRLTYFRGVGDCRASSWTPDPQVLGRAMSTVRCHAGATQYRRALSDLLKEARQAKVAGCVVIGDAFEEHLDEVAAIAGELGMLGVRGFFFHEGRDMGARRAFEELARAMRGVCLPFDAGAADALRQLLGAAAAYAAGGDQGLRAYAERKGGAARQVAGRLTGPEGS